jgi:hypothetical protein
VRLRLVVAVPAAIEHLVRQQPISGGANPSICPVPEMIEGEEHPTVAAFVRRARPVTSGGEALAGVLGNIQEEFARRLDLSSRGHADVSERFEAEHRPRRFWQAEVL